jgi:RNA polymerase sigma-70 factor (ECF subfamily)
MSATVLSFRARKDEAHEPWTDEAVAAACCSGDPRAIAELFERFQLPITRFLSRAQGGADVEDLVQTTFMLIARGKCRFDGRSSVKTWLFGIATNVMRQHFRSKMRRRKLTFHLLASPRTDSFDRVLEQVDARRDIRLVEAAFAELPEPSRLAFVLCELEGLSAKEAGRVLNASESAIWKRVSDARKALLLVVGGENESRM